MHFLAIQIAILQIYLIDTLLDYGFYECHLFKAQERRVFIPKYILSATSGGYCISLTFEFFSNRI